MIHPDKIGVEAKKMEDENYKFRSYLKEHEDEEVDKQFLKEDGSCMLGDCKSDSCKKYPYTDQPERLCSLLGMLDTITICLVAFEIFERLKKVWI